MTRSEALEYVVAMRKELGYSQAPFEVLYEIFGQLAEFDNTKENIMKFVEYHF